MSNNTTILSIDCSAKLSARKSTKKPLKNSENSKWLVSSIVQLFTPAKERFLDTHTRTMAVSFRAADINRQGTSTENDSICFKKAAG